MTNLDIFHPQFQALVRHFLVQANAFFLQFSEPEVQSRVTSRKVFLNDDLRVNASVGRDVDGYAIYTITAGAIAALADVSLTLSATNDFFPEVQMKGEAIETHTSYDRSHFVAYDQLRGRQPLPHIPIRIIKNDPVRISLGASLFDIASRFLMLHEQMHFIRGHLHYLFGATAPGALEEIPRAETTLLPAVESRALELDADGSAFATLLAAFEQRDVMLGDFKPLITDRWGWYRVVTVAVLGVMMLLSIADEENHVESERRHPSTQVRMLNLLGVLTMHAREMADFTAGSPHPTIIRLFKDVATTSGVLRISPPSAEAFTEWQSVNASEVQHPVCMELRDLHLIFDSLLPRLR